MFWKKCYVFLGLLACLFPTRGSAGFSNDDMGAVDGSQISMKQDAGGDYGYYTTTIDPDTIGSDCIDRKGRRIPVGQDYHPEIDSPCTICECMEDKRISSCSSVGCEVLACINFDIDEDSCCGYTCKDGGTIGTLDLRQVGKDSVIVQWSLDDPKAENVSWHKMAIFYSEGFGKEKPWIELPTRLEDRSAMVSGLKYGVNYTFNARAKLYSDYGVVLAFQGAQIVLEQRAGNFLKLVRQEHEKHLSIALGYGARFQWQPIVYMNLNAFDYASVGKKTNKVGLTTYMMRLYNFGRFEGKPSVKMFTRDFKLFRWIKAHF